MKKSGIDHFHIGLGVSYPDIYKEELQEYVSVKLTTEEIDEHKKFYSNAYAKLHGGKKWDSSDWAERSKQYFGTKKKLPYVKDRESQDVKYIQLR